ncbi:MAG: hypothetical protein AAF226_03390, partial [Verrucomicrobiota bacterium]
LPGATLGGTLEWTFGPDHFIPGNVSITDPPSSASAQEVIFNAYNGTSGDPANSYLPEVRMNPLNNQITWHFGTWEQDLEEDSDGDGNADGLQPAIVDILFTVRVNDEPFADGLFLTNQGEFAWDNTRTADGVNAIAQIETLAPELQIRKGILAVSPQGQPGGFNFDTNGGVGNPLYDSANENYANHEWAAYGEDDHYQTQTSGLTGAVAVTGTAIDNLRYGSVKGSEFGKAYNSTTGGSTYAISGDFYPENTGGKEIEDESFIRQHSQSEDNRGRLWIGSTSRLDHVRVNDSNGNGNDTSQWVVPGSVEFTAIQLSDQLLQNDGSTHSTWTSRAGPKGGTIIDDAVSGGALTFFDVPDADGRKGTIYDKDGNSMATIDYETGLIRGTDNANYFGTGSYFPEGEIELRVSYDVYDVLIQSTSNDAKFQTNAFDDPTQNSHIITNVGPASQYFNSATPIGSSLSPAVLAVSERIDPGSVSFDIQNGLDTVTDNGAGGLIQTSTGSLVGNIDYASGNYKFGLEGLPIGTYDLDLAFTWNLGINVFDSSAATHPGISFPQVEIAETLAWEGDIGDYNLVPGTVRIAVDDTSQQIIIVDVPDVSTSGDGFSGSVADEAIEGALHEFDPATGTLGPAIGHINYNNGDIRFQVGVANIAGEDRAEVKIDYDRWQASEHYITSNYLHDRSEFTSENQREQWAAFVDSDARNLDAGDVVTYGIFVENIGGGNAKEIEIFDAFFNGVSEADVDTASDDPFNATHLLPATAGFNGAPGDSFSATAADVQDFMDAFNFKVYRGDGLEMTYGKDFLFEYTLGGGTLGQYDNGNTLQGTGLDHPGSSNDVTNDGFWRIVVHEGELEAGRNSGEVLTNDTGSNVLFISYDVVIDQTATPGHWTTNEVYLTSYTDKNVAQNPGDPADEFIDSNNDGKYTAPENYIDANGNGAYDVGEFFADADGDGSRYAGDVLTLDRNGNGEYDSSYEDLMRYFDAITADDDVVKDGADFTIAHIELNKVLLATDQSHTGEAEVTIENVRDELVGFASAEEGDTWDYALQFSDFSDISDLTLNGEEDANGIVHRAIQHDYVEYKQGSTSTGQIGNNFDPNGLKTIDLDAGTSSYVAGTAGLENTTNDDLFANTAIKMSGDHGDHRGMTSSFFHNAKQDVTGDFETEFEFTVSNRSGGLSRGFALVLHNDPAGASAFATGSSSEYTSGFDSANGSDRIDDAFAVEFWKNGGDSRIIIHENNGSSGNGTETTLGRWNTWVNDSDGSGTDFDQTEDEDTVFRARVTYDASSQTLHITVRDEYGHESSYEYVSQRALADVVSGADAFIGFTSDSAGAESILINSWTHKASQGDDFHTARSTPQNVNITIRNDGSDDRISGLSGNSGTRNQNTDIDSGEDVTIGEEVIYGLVVKVPEADVNTFALYDNLPEGLEVLDWELVLDPTQDVFGGLANAADITDATHHTSTPFDTAWAGGNANDWQNNILAEVETSPGTYVSLQEGYVADAANRTGALRFVIPNTVGLQN